jgi:hypothetical protein
MWASPAVRPAHLFQVLGASFITSEQTLEVQETLGEWKIFHQSRPMKSSRLDRESSRSRSSCFAGLEVRARLNKTSEKALGVLEAAGPEIVGLFRDFPL